MRGQEPKEEGVEWGGGVAGPGGWEGRADSRLPVTDVRPRLRHCPAQTETEWQHETQGKGPQEAARGLTGRVTGNRLGGAGVGGLPACDGLAGAALSSGGRSRPRELQCGRGGKPGGAAGRRLGRGPFPPRCPPSPPGGTPPAAVAAAPPSLEQTHTCQSLPSGGRRGEARGKPGTRAGGGTRKRRRRRKGLEERGTG